jgi:hypothetical protein
MTMGECTSCAKVFSIRNNRNTTSASNKLCGKCYLVWKREQRKRRGLK